MPKNDFSMNYKIIIFLFLFLDICSNLFSQDCPPSYDKGSLFNREQSGKPGYFCFKRDPEPPVDSLPEVYHTKYTIAFGKGRETYNIHVYFYKMQDSISIKYMNTTSGKTTSTEIAFKEHSSIRLFKNYKTNDTTISENEQYCTLFTIPDTLRPYITLNLFQLPENPGICLVFSQVTPDKLAQHREETAAYFRWEDSVGLARKLDEDRRIKLKNSMDSLLRDMNDYKAMAILKIRKSDSLFALNGPVQEANATYSEEFKLKIDPLFIESLKKELPFENSDSELKLSFICNGLGKMDIQKVKMEPTGSPVAALLENSFKQDILPVIEAWVYRTGVIQRTDAGLVNDFNKRYSAAIDQFSKETAVNSIYKEFLAGRNKILAELDVYMLTREVNTPTRYSYSARYRSEVTTADWIYEIDRKGNEKIGPKKPVEPVLEELKTIFKTKIAKPGVGKYHIKISRVYFNNKIIGQDIRLEETKK